MELVLGSDKRQPWSWFFVKAGLLLGALFVAGSMFADRYRVGITAQAVTCIPGYRVFLIDTQNTTPERGAIFAFKANGITPWLEEAVPEAKPLIPHFADGKMLVKYMEAVPGDVVEVTENGVAVNGAHVADGLKLSATLRKLERNFVRTERVPADAYWFGGKTYDSFDSRYWGIVARTQLVGRAYPIF
jgi:conjugal transfer pilin signal peptidase TrbI